MTAQAPFDNPENEMAKQLRGFGPIGILAMVIILGGNFLFIPLSGILVLVWRGMSNTPWKQIGYVAPNSWIKTILVGLLFGITFKLFMKAVVMPLLGAPAINQSY